MSVKKPKTIKDMNIVWDKFIKYVESHSNYLSKKEYEESLVLYANDIEEYMVKPYDWRLSVNPSIEGFNQVWRQFMEEATTGVEVRKEISALFNNFLDNILSQDGFGTEGQHDPRGDHRD